ncbi:MAG: MerR family transcriptional regulator [Dehalococcoidia bacterium]
MAELSEASGLPVATIKYYLREGLLPGGTRTAPNQAAYDDSHLRRLRLIRSLREVGGLGIDQIRRTIRSLDEGARPWDVVGAVSDAIGGDPGLTSRDTAWHAASAEVSAFLAARGLPHRPESTARARLVDALIALRRALGIHLPAESLADYADAMEALAKLEIAATNALNTPTGPDPGASPAEPESESRPDLALTLEAIVYGTVLFEPVILAMRRLWHERFAAEQGLGGPWQGRNA